MAPEIWNRHQYDHKVDIWAMGVILYILTFNDGPFSYNNEAIYQNIIENCCNKTLNLNDLVKLSSKSNKEKLDSKYSKL